MDQKYKILCIGDSKSVHAFLRECVKPISADFQSAFDGEQGIGVLTQNPKAFDIIFLDWEMPKKDGPTTYMEMKTLGVSCPVFMLTSKNATDDIAKMLDAGVTEYILKPFTQDIIIDKVKQFVG